MKNYLIFFCLFILTISCSSDTLLESANESIGFEKEMIIDVASQLGIELGAYDFKVKSIAFDEAFMSKIVKSIHNADFDLNNRNALELDINGNAHKIYSLASLDDISKKYIFVKRENSIQESIVHTHELGMNRILIDLEKGQGKLEKNMDECDYSGVDGFWDCMGTCTACVLDVNNVSGRVITIAGIAGGIGCIGCGIAGAVIFAIAEIGCAGGCAEY